MANLNDVDNFVDTRNKFKPLETGVGVNKTLKSWSSRSNEVSKKKLGLSKVIKQSNTDQYHYRYNKANTSNQSVLSTTTTTKSPTTTVGVSTSTEREYQHNQQTTNPYTNIPQQEAHSQWSTRLSPSIDGNWSQWSTFGPCISECVAPRSHLPPIGIMTSLRQCNNPSPDYGGMDCSGPDTRVKLCNAINVSSRF